jgi:hypothetical protein
VGGLGLQPFFYMRIDIFRKLKEVEQYDLVFNRGDFVTYFLRGDQRFALYSLFAFFVEVEYAVSRNEIVTIIAFEDGKLLDRYWIATDLLK